MIRTLINFNWTAARMHNEAKRKLSGTSYTSVHCKGEIDQLEIGWESIARIFCYFPSYPFKWTWCQGRRYPRGAMKHLYARRLLRLCLRLKHQQHHLSPSSISASSSSSISSSGMARKTVKEAVNSFADKTSMHGVPSLVRARNPRAKLFWSLVCVVAMGMFIFMLISLILKYFQYPVIVKVDQVSMFYLSTK